MSEIASSKGLTMSDQFILAFCIRFPLHLLQDDCIGSLVEAQGDGVLAVMRRTRQGRAARADRRMPVYAVRMTACRRSVSLYALWMTACVGQGETLLGSAVRSEDTVAFAVDLWPGEGIPVIEMQDTALLVRAQPDPAAEVVDTLRGRTGQRVAFDSTRYQTIATGAFEILQPFQLTGRDLGAIRRLTLDQYYHSSVTETSIPLPAPATIEFLQYRAEGTCFVRIDRRVIDAQPCPGFGRESVTVVREPVTRWWILTRGTRGVPGWLLVSDTTARSVRREF